MELDFFFLDQNEYKENTVTSEDLAFLRVPV